MTVERTSQSSLSWMPPTPRQVKAANTRPSVAWRVADVLMMVVLILSAINLFRLSGDTSPMNWFTVAGGILVLSQGVWGIYSAYTGQRYLPPRRIRRLCETGVAVPGRFVERRGGMNGRIVWYTFERPDQQQDVTWTDVAYNRAALRRLAPGDAVTVLYDPKNPEKSTVYETCGYEVQSAAGEDDSTVRHPQG